MLLVLVPVRHFKEVGKLVKTRRGEITEEKNARKETKD
jgi:hypothetical protein